MEKLQALLTWVKSLPNWAKWSVIAIVALAASITVFTACSTTYRVVSSYKGPNDTVKIETTVKTDASKK